MFFFINCERKTHVSPPLQNKSADNRNENQSVINRETGNNRSEKNLTFDTKEKPVELPNTINVNGIEITAEIAQFISQSREIKNEYIELVKKSLKKDKTAFAKLTDFECDGASCYYHGSVIVQIIYRIGEDKAVKIFQELESDKACRKKSLIEVGLEYGDNDYDQKPDNKLIEKDFPKLHKLFTEKQKCLE